MVTITLAGASVALGGRTILDPIDARLEPGALIGVIGPNGAGKSTLVKAALGLLPLMGGQITFDNQILELISRPALAKRIAYLPQGQQLHWPLTVERLVALGRLPHLGPFSTLTDIDREAIRCALQDADMLHLRHRTATELSGGERARALLARAFAVGAPALIADEPLAALDPGHQLHVMTMLRQRAAAGGLVVAVLHDLTMAARHCDRLLLLDRGRLIADGPPARILTPHLLRTIYGIEAHHGSAAGAPLIVPIQRSAPEGLKQ